MSNIYIQEPPTNGKVLLKTTVGDIDIELWAKETPKACRNFIQLCEENYYNGTIFHRVVKGFIVQGGDPTGTGTGGESVYGQPFKDEFHSRLRFNRRGLLAMANAGRDDNCSQFFFTMSATPELQNKHTIFGKVTGETIFNMLKLEDALVDKDERPLYPQKIIRTEILLNPFPDIVPRTVASEKTTHAGKEKTKEKNSGVKNFKLLSFGEEAEEDEEEMNEANRIYSGRSKSTHDLLDDPHLSDIPAVESKTRKRKDSLENQEADNVQEENTTPSEHIEEIRKKLRNSVGTSSTAEPTRKVKRSEDEADSQDTDHKDKHKIDDIKKQIKDLKRELQRDKQLKADAIEEEEQKEKDEIKNLNEDVKPKALETYRQEQSKYRELKEKIPREGSSRENFTLSLLTLFQKKLASAKEKSQENCENEQGEGSVTTPDVAAEESRGQEEEDSWLVHKLKFEANLPVLAKDASTKNDDWFEIYDPRNPINKRRRETSKNKDKR